MVELSQITLEMLSKLDKKLGLDPTPQYGTTIPGYIDAAVLILFVYVDQEWHLLFTRRTNTVSDHKGQVSFPGGAREDVDQTPVDTAIRETFEEIGIYSEDIQPMGSLPGMKTITHYFITPIVGISSWPTRIQLATDEVDRVFTVPVAWLADRSHHEMRPFQGIGNQVREVIFYDQYDGEIIWGITAAITECVIDRMNT